MSATLENVQLRRIDGTSASLADYEGKVLLIVNVASKCGFTPQYEGLEKLYARFSSRGFAVLGFPANDFAEQEPGTNVEIAQFCTTNFGVKFPMFEKITVAGPKKHPLYASLIAAQPKPTTSTDSLRQHLIEFGVTPESRTRGAVELREVSRKSDRFSDRALRAGCGAGRSEDHPAH